MDAHGNKTPICYHVYQRSNDGGLLFYCAKDFLVTYTIVSVCARKRGIIVLGFCQMFDHIHGLFVVQTPEELSDFVRDYSAMIAREFNRATGRTGPVLEHSFGRAAKVGDKKIRTALAYLYNNPVERKLCTRAEDYRWNYLAFARSKSPFSRPLVFRDAGIPMRKAIREVQYVHRSGTFLNHTLLSRLFRRLDSQEINQLTDWIIHLWSFISYDSAIRYYGSFDQMILAFASNTGSEYDIRESFDARSDQVYLKMTLLLMKAFPTLDPISVSAMDISKKISLYWWLRDRTNANSRQIEKYLHLQTIRRE